MGPSSVSASVGGGANAIRNEGPSTPFLLYETRNCCRSLLHSDWLRFPRPPVKDKQTPPRKISIARQPTWQERPTITSFQQDPHCRSYDFGTFDTAPSPDRQHSTNYQAHPHDALRAILLSAPAIVCGSFMVSPAFVPRDCQGPIPDSFDCFRRACHTISVSHGSCLGCKKPTAQFLWQTDGFTQIGQSALRKNRVNRINLRIRRFFR